MGKAFIFTLLIVLSACSSKKEGSNISKAILTELNANNWKMIDFSKTVPFTFEKVCILGPYSSNAFTKQALGFSWDTEKETNISMNDGINLIVFVKDNKVISYVEQRRDQGDFWKLSGKCFDYAHAKLTRTSRKSDWTYKK